MSQFFDVLVSNPLLVFLIIGGIYKFFFDNKDEEEEVTEQTKKTVSKSNKKEPIPMEKSIITEKNPVHRERAKEELASRIENIDIEEQQQQQLEQFAKKIDTNASVTLDQIERQIEEARASEHILKREKGKRMPVQQRNFQRQMKGQLTKKGLVEGIIMAEVLGQPRAQKKYQPITSKRKMG